ncbi:MAG TPA: enoyl-CoA hydratase/isomerase family protein [Anaerolineales bacterium]|nr:enoyl-CoA hydratase/isomerase family protein [Anaerolineales bacterium]
MQMDRWVHISLAAQDGVARLSLHRPPANVLNVEALSELNAAVEAVSRDATLKVLVLSAEGKQFCAGVDVADHTPQRVGEMIPAFDRLCRGLAGLPCVTLAVVQGHALGGGCELVTCCDLAVMARGAHIGQPEIRLAVIAPIAALRLPSLVGPRWAARLLFTGEPLEADPAAAIGLVSEAVAPEALGATADAWVEQLRGLSTPALRLLKRAFQLGVDAWAQAIPAVERLYLDELMQTEDAQEGLQAFLEKRKPVWRNR